MGPDGARTNTNSRRSDSSARGSQRPCSGRCSATMRKSGRQCRQRRPFRVGSTTEHRGTVGVGVVALALWCHFILGIRSGAPSAQHRTAPHSTAQHRTAPHSTARLHVLLSAPLPPPCCRDTQAQLGRRVALLLDRSRRSARTQHEQRRRRAAHHSSVGGRWGWGWGCHPYGGAVVVSDCGGRSSAARLAWRGHRDRAHGRRPHACRL